MALTGSTNEQKIWNYLKSKGLNNYGAAGLMGNLYAESGLKPTNLQNTGEKRLGYTDDEYTAAVDNGAYVNFVKDSAGYGLAQWTYHSRKANMLAFAKAAGASIGDLEMQLDFLFQELSGSYKAVLNILKTAASVKEASDIVLTKFERPADQSTTAKTRRAGYGQKYFDKYASGTAPSTSIQNGGKTMTETELRQLIVNTAKAWLGCKESDGSHRQIIDVYNSHKPYARGYKMTYTGAWCSTFASAVAIKAGLTDIIPTEVGCERHIELFKKLDSWVEDDSYVPSPGDYLFYDWDDPTGSAGDTKGWSDHVAIVVEVVGDTIKTIEGNVSDSVAYRQLKVNGKYIRGFGVPKYASKAGSMSAPHTDLQPSTSVPTAPDTSNTLAFAKGDTVEFTGSKHYTSSNSTNGKSCKPGKAQVTNVAKSGKHPYHLVRVQGGGSTVYGWVDAADIKTEGAAAIVVGSKVKVKSGAKTYTGGRLASFVYTTTYYVRQLNGDRAVIAPAKTGAITAAIKVSDLILQ